MLSLLKHDTQGVYSEMTPMCLVFISWYTPFHNFKFNGNQCMDKLNDEFKKHLNLSFTKIGLKTHTPKAKTLRILISAVLVILLFTFRVTVLPKTTVSEIEITWNSFQLCTPPLILIITYTYIYKNSRKGKKI